MGDNETFGSWLRRRRRSTGLTQGELAECAGCSIITIRKFEADERRPSRQLAELLADCLQIPAEEREHFVRFARQMEMVAAPAGPKPVALPAAPPPSSRPPEPSVRPARLPVPLTSFIGRDDALDRLLTLIRDAHARPLTLIGAGGSGKTRLALEVAIDADAELGDLLPEGVFWVDLAPLEDGTRLAATVSQALGLLEAGGQPSEEMLAAYLAGRRLLLVLDNCEHLIDAAARLVERLLRRCPGVQLMATSREPLGVPGETIFAVPTLSLPDLAAAPETMLTSEAARLFVERAAAQRPGFRLTADNAADVAQICRRLDGIPLALELAAARVRVLSPAQIAARLDDRFTLLTGGARTALPRQQTLRALIDWSHDLLEPGERVLFHRLAVFAGSWTLEAAERVTSDEQPAASGIHPAAPPLAATQIVELLSRLIDKSLIQIARDDEDGPRYEMLETIRAYARERLEASGELPALRARHLAYYVAWMEQAEPQLCGLNQALWLSRVEHEYDNLRLALRRTLVESVGLDPVAGARLAGALGQFWLRRNYPQEGARWTALALERGVAAPARVRAAVYSAAGSMAWLSTDLDRSAACHEEAERFFREAGDLGWAAMSIRNRAVQAQWQGQPERATALSAEATELARAAGDRWAYGSCLLNLGLCYYYMPGYGNDARRTLEESVAVLREVGDGWPMAIGLCALGMQAAHDDEHEWAQAYIAEALQIVTELGDPRLEALTWQSWGKVLRVRGEPAGAAAALRRSLPLFARTSDQANTIETLEELVVALAKTGTEPATAARLLGATEAWREKLQAVVNDDLTLYLPDAEPALRAALGEDAFAKARARGRDLTLSEAIALAAS